MKRISFLMLIVVIFTSLSCQKMPTAGFTASSTSVEIGDSVFFVNSSVHAASYSWSFGDGVNSEDENPFHIYTSGGTFTVTLKASSKNGNSTDVTRKFIEVSEATPIPVASFKLPEIIAVVDRSVAFSNTSYNSVGYLWEFGDGQTSTNVSTTHTYSAAGEYLVILTAYSIGGKKNDTASANITVYEDLSSYFLGTWELTEAYDSTDVSVLSLITDYYITAIEFSETNSLISTAGPMTLYASYGENRYSSVNSQMGNVFNYPGTEFTIGEYFIQQSAQDRVTINMKIEYPGLLVANNIFSGMNLPLPATFTDDLVFIMYHKFSDIQVTFNINYDEMYWTFDYNTSATHNSQDHNGDLVVYEGLPNNELIKGRYVFTKRVGTLQDILL